jgi:hypothetical protein
MGKIVPSMTTQSQAAQEVRRLMEKRENIEAEMVRLLLFLGSSLSWCAHIAALSLLQEGHRGRLEAVRSFLHVHLDSISSSTDENRPFGLLLHYVTSFDLALCSYLTGTFHDELVSRHPRRLSPR